MGTAVTSSPAAPAGVSAFRPLVRPSGGSAGSRAATGHSAFPGRFTMARRSARPRRRPPDSTPKRIILVLGGARSGKSQQALALARGFKGPKVFIATAEALDVEMAERIRRHREERGVEWRTVEEPLHLQAALDAEIGRAGVVVIDCLTLWIANLLAQVPAPDDLAIEASVREVGRILAAHPFNAIVVSNEVGLGIVPADPSVRRYRDLMGLVNQQVAALADRVVLMVAGWPLVVGGRGANVRA